ncbi:hypothetical protein PanWU01x14_047170 [Parasponia andersonii]|uniref:Uncharacterized protein n=1 Tax=Parasponia andersonii TaxID=3476 RepID=A0A2P5DNY9_PARAD|nr:hypothetical protein PanWU01x14_047170 [Parasponia andersonii]
MIENLQCHREDIEPGNCNNVDELLYQTHVMTIHDFLVEDDEFKDGALEKYNDKEIDLGSNDSDICLVWRLPPTGSTCSSGSGRDNLDPKGKRIHQESRGIMVLELWRQKFIRLVVPMAEKSGKPVQQNNKIFNNLLA